MVSSENMHSNDILQTEYAIVRNTYIRTYMRVMTINGKRDNGFERAKICIYTHTGLEGKNKREKSYYIITS